MAFLCPFEIPDPGVLLRALLARLHVPHLLESVLHHERNRAVVGQVAGILPLLASPRSEGVEVGDLGGLSHPGHHLLHGHEPDVFVLGKKVVHEVEQRLGLIAVCKPVYVEVETEGSPKRKQRGVI